MTSRLNQILSGVPCEYGFYEVALESIPAFFKDVRPIERRGTVVLDEIKLRESVDFNKSTLNFDGFVDFGGPSGEQVEADHALLFSRSVAVGLKFYREQGKPGFEDTEGTESFTRKMNDLFDSLNAKCPAEGIRKNSPQMKVIIEFIDMLNSTEEESVNNTKLFASQMTTESLRVTLMSVIDIMTWLHNKDVRYVLTAKLNQDPLEADPVLVSVEKSLSAKKLEALSRKEDRQRKLATVIGQIELQEDVDGDALQRSDSRSAASTAVLYYLGGYVVKKAAKMTSCSDCHCTLEAAPDAAPAAVLTELRSFVPGALKHPSAALTCMLSGIECVIERHTKSNQVFGDLFWRILEELSEKTLSRVGCPLHFQKLSARIIKIYLATRRHFYSRFLEQHQSSSAQVKAARKRAKLL
ncbi:hypothetical protein HPB51_005973 [Rhipicephalus microplus]|uniref:Transposable element P transposase-like GTP-binding insertion domain-containing protein n=1 Tax=Rhipicephalus microplus TaxID=6941 RepID=A0A9J6E793_RHIMP|nr:hypothetical protein HPB51_005973 [Rhipicephalus microplus]